MARTARILGSDGEEADSTQSERAARLIERAIMEGDLKPGERLGVHQLSKRYGLGVTPIREGLSRLAYRGFVVALDNRGFRVADASLADLEDITRLRMTVEVDALRLAMLYGDDAWEARVLGAMHQLERSVTRTGTADAAGVPDALHKAFHMALFSGCGSPRMLELCSLLFDQAYRYRRLFFDELHLSADDLVSEHREIAKAVLDRQIEAAAQLYAQHINRTVTNLYPDAEPVPLIRPSLPLAGP